MVPNNHHFVISSGLYRSCLKIPRYSRVRNIVDFVVIAPLAYRDCGHLGTPVGVGGLHSEADGAEHEGLPGRDDEHRGAVP